MKMNIESFLNSVEKIFRYFIPGFLLVFLLKLAYAEIGGTILSNISKVEFIILIPCLGMMVYGIHRVIYWVVFDAFFAKLGIFPESVRGKKYAQTLADFISWRIKKENSAYVAYLHYRWAILHYCLIFSELVFLFSFFHDEGTFFAVRCTIARWGSAIFWFVVMIHYVYMLLSENIISKKKSEPDLNIRHVF